MGLTSFSDFAVGQLMGYPLTVTTVGNGSVTKNPDAPLYVHGTYVQLTAVPVTGYHLVSWSGDATGTQNPLLILMDRPRSITATFAINTYTLDVTVIGSGTVAKEPRPADLQPRHASDAHRDPVDRLHVHRLERGSDRQHESADRDDDREQRRSRQRSRPTSTRSPSAPVGNRTVSKNPDQPTYTHGTVVSSLANPAVGWHRRAGAATRDRVQNPLSVTMNGPKNITATFAINTYTLAVNDVRERHRRQTPLTSRRTRTARSSSSPPRRVAHYHLVGWSGDASGSANPLSVTMDGNRASTATFAADRFVLTTSAWSPGLRRPNA